jgi:hypothetical protein
VSTILGFDLDSVRKPHGRWPTGYGIHRCVDPNEEIDVEQFLRLELSPDGSIEIFWVAP